MHTAHIAKRQRKTATEKTERQGDREHSKDQTHQPLGTLTNAYRDKGAGILAAVGAARMPALADLCEWVGRMNGIDFEEVDDD